MSALSDPVRYNAAARAIHWISAVLVIANLALGLLHDPLEDIVNLMPLHKSVGLSVLALAVLRLVLRMTWRRPPWPASVTAFQRRAASLVHGAFYVLILAMPLTGWVMSSAGKYPLTWFGLVEVAKLPVTRSDPIYGLSHGAHEWLGWLTLALVVLHAGAALYHHFVLGDEVLRRMA